MAIDDTDSAGDAAPDLSIRDAIALWWLRRTFRVDVDGARTPGRTLARPIAPVREVVEAPADEAVDARGSLRLGSRKELILPIV